jgi:hypothetical protein
MYAYSMIILYSIDIFFLNCTIVKSPFSSELHISCDALL